MVRLSVAPAVGVVVAALSENCVAVPVEDTVTGRPVPLEIEPSVTTMFTDSAL